MIASVLAAAIVMAQFSQTATGDLHIIVADAQGMPVQCGVEIISAANQLRETLAADAAGVAVARRLPFGSYRVVVARAAQCRFVALASDSPAFDCPSLITSTPASGWPR